MTIYQNAVGKIFRIDIGQSINTATLMRMDITKPSGTVLQKTATQYGETEKITYTSIAGDLDEVGVYTLNSYVEWGTVKEIGDTYHFEVYAKGTISEEEVIDSLPAYTFIESAQTEEEEEDAENTDADLLYPIFRTYFRRAKNDLADDLGTTLTLNRENEIAALCYLIASYVLERDPSWAASSKSQPGGGSISRNVDSRAGGNITDPERSYQKVLAKAEAAALGRDPLIEVLTEVQVHDDETYYQSVREGTYDPTAED